MNKILVGDCLIKLKELEDNSVDSIVTDPPYELGFMGKSWDNTGIANNPLMWAECLRVLKPGGHILAFSGTRTYHRMASAIEDAGFEVRDMIEWVYGSGFPKSLSIGKAINSLETKEWSKIGKALDNIDQESKMEVWKRYLDNVESAVQQLSKSEIIAGQDTPREIIVQAFALVKDKLEDCNFPVNIAKVYFTDHQANETKINTVLQNVEAEIRQLQDPAKFAELLSQNPNPKSWLIFTAECDVKDWLNENTMVSHKVDEALKTLRGNKKYSNEEITSVLCAVIPSVLKHTILNQSKTFQSLDTNQKMECASAINVIITEYIMDNLISNTVAILKSKAVDKLQGNEREVVGKTQGQGTPVHSGNFKTGEQNITKGTSEYEGWGTALKPAHEPICMARKPLSEKTVASNCLKWGTGGINIDESRVGTEVIKNAPPSYRGKTGEFVNQNQNFTKGKVEYNIGRFPANLILSDSEEVRECFPETKTGGVGKGKDSKGQFYGGGFHNPETYNGGDSGNASRFFKSIPQEIETTPSHEPICMARKPLSEKTVAENCLKWGTGGINIDESRVGTEQRTFNSKGIRSGSENYVGDKDFDGQGDKTVHGRFPANLILSDSEEVRECFPETKSGNLNSGHKRGDGTGNSFMGGGGTVTGNYGGDSGNASRFFKSIIYNAKASKSERNKGCEGLEDSLGGSLEGGNDKRNGDKPQLKPTKNSHPTVKPIALMEYLIKMVTPKGGIVLDPFAGSGSTLVAAKQNGFQYIGIEMTEEYIPIINARLNI